MITFQYFDGCPNAQAILDNLREAGVAAGVIPREDIREKLAAYASDRLP